MPEIAHERDERIVLDLMIEVIKNLRDGDRPKGATETLQLYSECYSAMFKARKAAYNKSSDD